MKKILTFSLSIIFVLLSFVSCQTTTNLFEPEATESSEQIEHNNLIADLEKTSFETPYNELYSLYESINLHSASHGCEIETEELLENMLFGKWVDSNKNYIESVNMYTDYNNTKLTSTFGTNLENSQISGNTYYFYSEEKDNKLVIGYKDKITEEKTDNYFITFNEKSISVYNAVDKKTYTLYLKENSPKLEKDNAKNAYIYIAKNILTFKYPASVKVTLCYFDCEEKVAYVTIQATNGFGGTNNTDYKLYEIGGRYYIDEYSHDKDWSNVDLDELNEKLQAFVANGG